MEQTIAPKPPPMPLPYLPSSVEGSRDLQCVGKMEIVRPKPVGFLCGSIPVLADSSFPTFTSALLPSQETVCAPRFRMLPMETDLNRPPLLTDFADKVLPLSAVKSRITGDISKEANVVASNLSKKCEALAVLGLVDYGDEIDVIAPVDILKQIFKIPYSKARVSIVVQRIGQTLVLNPGPDVEEGEKMIRQHNNQPKCTKNVDESLFLNFAMHSVRMEACDCPPTHLPDTDKQSSSSALPVRENIDGLQKNGDSVPDDRLDNPTKRSKQFKQDAFICEKKKSNKNKEREPIRTNSQVSEKIKPSGDSEKHRRGGSNEFLRVLFWQFHNFRMLLGSDLLLFSNEKYLAVSLHLWDVSQQVTPLTWLEAWLDNVMASVPELAICYHQNGVVQGYELLKTDDIFLLKGISEDGTPAFHPHVVQQNGLTVLRFLQSNCQEDPGAYWLYKSAGEDVIQLFDLSIISKNHSSSDHNDTTCPLPSLIHSGRIDSLFSLGNLLYRVGHRLSLSMVLNDRTKCATFLRKCLNIMDEPDHLVVRAYAHEQYARLILNNYEEVDLIFESNNVQREVKITDLEEESLDPFTADHESEAVISSEEKFTEDYLDSHVSPLVSVRPKLEADVSPCEELLSSDSPDSHNTESSVLNSSSDASVNLGPVCQAPLTPIQTTTSSISSKLAAVHHVSQAIKSLRWTRQLQSSEQEGAFNDILPSTNFSKCSCGDPDCIEVCDIRKWLPTSKLDRKLWNLVLLLGESYLSLGEAYKEDGLLHQALNTVELACSIYGSMPHKFEETLFVSSMNKSLSLQSKSYATTQVEDLEAKSGPCDIRFGELSSTRLFWAKVWMLVGDIYVQFHILKGQELSRRAEATSTNQLRMPSEVVTEVQRLKKKLTECSQNCASCSLVNCSCKSDRASSGSSASSSSNNGNSSRTVPHVRKHNRKSQSKYVASRLSRNVEDERVNFTVENRSDKEEDTSVGTKEAASQEQNELNSKETPGGKKGGIFKYLKGSKTDDTKSNLLAAVNCYEETRRALQELPSCCNEFQSVIRKKGWVCNELGRNHLVSKELNKAEDAFADAIAAFKEVCDHSNVILINCNLGHGRRALAEEMVSKMEALKLHPAFKNAYQQALGTAKLEYGKSLRYYMAAKAELSAAKEASLVPDNLKVEVHTQLGHTYLRFGMLLAKEDTTAAACGQKSILENIHDFSSDGRSRDLRKHEVSASDAIREALALYESLGDIRKQEAAYAYLQLARYHKDCCLRFLETERQGSSPKPEGNVIQRAKQYALLADRNWQKSIDFYGPDSHPSMFLTILIERAALSFSLSNFWQSNSMLESALSRLLDGRHISKTYSESLRTEEAELYTKVWAQLQMVLKRMLALSLPREGANKFQTSGRSGECGKLRELYKTSLKSTSLRDLNTMHVLWTSSSLSS